MVAANKFSWLVVILSFATIHSERARPESPLGPLNNLSLITTLALDHPLCSTNVTAYAGQTATLHCCLARVERDLSVSWIRREGVAVIAHGHDVFTSDPRIKVSWSDGVWSMSISRVGMRDGGLYECQTNDAVKRSVLVNLDIVDTRAEILGKVNKFVKAGDTLRLACRVFLGPQGPDDDYKRTAVVHWFHGQRLLDPLLGSRLRMESEIDKEVRGGLVVDGVTAFDAGNYTCVPSFARPDSVTVHVLQDERNVGMLNEVSEVKTDVAQAIASHLKGIAYHLYFCLVALMQFYPRF